MKIIGITGNYGAGKSEIARMFEKFNCKIINLDKLGHEILKSPKFKKELINTFGKYILDKDEISRDKLRKVVFYNPEYLIKLNKIIHPELKSRLKKEIEKNKKKDYKAIVIDAALIFELNIGGMMDKIITVSTNKLITYLRLLGNRNITFADFKKIFASQMPLKEKKKKADYILYNNLPMKYNCKKINKTIEKILE